MKISLKKSDKLSTEIVDTKKVNQPKESPKQNTEIQKKATSAKAEEVKGDDEVKENKQEEQKEETIVVIPKKIEIWDELGITEDEYYNAPMWKWATVDFSILKLALNMVIRLEWAILVLLSIVILDDIWEK